MTLCTCGYRATVSVSHTITCPLCGEAIEALSQEDQGRSAWASLHAVEHPNPQWYAAWLETIPGYGCNCQDEWRKLTAGNPPGFSSLAAFRQWAIDRHNDVNLRLGKPFWPHENTGE